MESFTLKQLATLVRKSLTGTPAFLKLTEEMFEELYNHMYTTLGLIVVNRFHSNTPELNVFISSGTGFNFSDFKPNFLRSLLMTTSFDAKQAMEMIEVTENTLNILIERFGKVHIEKLGTFEIKTIPVWLMTASEEIAMPQI